MGRYWAIIVVSFLMRCVGVLCMIFSFLAIITLALIETRIIQPVVANDSFSYQLALGLTYLTYQFWALAGIPIGLGWYAGGQLITLLIDIEWNTRRVANRADAAQRRRQKVFAANPEDIRFWDEQIAAQRNNAPAPKPNLTPPSAPVRGQSTYRIQFNQDPKPRERRRLQSSEEPTDGDRYTYGRQGKRENE